MKKCKVIICSLIFVVLLAISFNTSKTISTNFKKVYANNQNDEVTDYDLALLATLVYEDVPNDKNYQKNTSNLNGCTVNKNGSVSANCKYNFYRNIFYRRDGYNVLKYVEGMSQRKLNLFTAITTTTIEDGQLYYFLDYADTSDASDWTIIDAQSKYTNPLAIKKSFEGIFDAVTFKKGNNYVISYRGTDFPDVLEWLQDLTYALGKHAQADDAYKYAQNVYDKYIKNNPNAKLYVTGHSLGAYLAQVGGIAVIEKERELGRMNNSALYKVAYFNGMGITALGIDKDNTMKQWIKDLEYLATTDRNGNKATNEELITNYGVPSSGRLVLYQMNEDPVSGLGIHFGDIINFKPALDSELYHTGTHSIVKGIKDFAYSVAEKGTKEYLEEYFNRIKDINWEDVKEDIEKRTEAILSKSISNTIYAIASGADTLSQGVYDFDADSLIENAKLRERAKSFRRTFKGLGDIIRLGINGGINNIIETANISHETDSFLCLNNDNGLPIVNILSSNDENAMVVIDGASTTKEKKEAVTTMWYKDANGFNIAADATAGCARKYQWYKIDNYDSSKKFDEQLKSEPMNIDKNSYDYKSEGPDETLAVKVNYGNIKRTMVIDDNLKYKIAKESGNEDSSVVQIIRIKQDNEAPVCTQKTSEYKISIKQKTGLFGRKSIVPGSANVTFECTDNAGMSTNFVKNISAQLDNNGTPPFSYSASIGDIEIKKVSEKTVKVVVPVKGSNDNYQPTLRVNIKPVDIFGNIGDSHLVWKLNIEFE